MDMLNIRFVGTQEKMGVEAEQQEEVVRDMVRVYVEGLCWVMAYYYDGASAGQPCRCCPVVCFP